LNLTILNAYSISDYICSISNRGHAAKLGLPWQMAPPAIPKGPRCSGGPSQHCQHFCSTGTFGTRSGEHRTLGRAALGSRQEGSGLGGAVLRRFVRLCARGRRRVRWDPEPGDQQSPLLLHGWRGACPSYIQPPATDRANLRLWRLGAVRVTQEHVRHTSASCSAQPTPLLHILVR
jgi:hypothetical protein